MSCIAPTPLLTAKDVAGYFQVSVRTIRRWRRDGQLSAPLQIGGSFRWRATDLQDCLRASPLNGTTRQMVPRDNIGADRC